MRQVETALGWCPGDEGLSWTWAWWKWASSEWGGGDWLMEQEGVRALGGEQGRNEAPEDGFRRLCVRTWFVCSVQKCTVSEWRVTSLTRSGLWEKAEGHLMEALIVWLKHVQLKTKIFLGTDRKQIPEMLSRACLTQKRIDKDFFLRNLNLCVLIDADR